MSTTTEGAVQIPTNDRILERLREMAQLVEGRLQSQDELLEQQRREIEFLRQKVADLRDERDCLLAAGGEGPDTWPTLTADQVKDMQIAGVTSEVLWARVKQIVGK